MQINVRFLFPFDMGLELDFVGKDAKEIFKQISTRRTQSLTFEGNIFSDSVVTTRIYKFGIGIPE